MSTDDTQTDEQQLEPDELTTTRREAMAVGAALGLPMFLGFGDDNDLGYFDTHYVANSGQKLAKDPPLLDFGSGLIAKETDEGVEVSSPTADSVLTEWTEQDDGTLEGPTIRPEIAALIDTGSDPSTEGAFQRNGADVKVHSGGSVRNLSDIGSGGSGGGGDFESGDGDQHTIYQQSTEPDSAEAGDLWVDI